MVIKIHKSNLEGKIKRDYKGIGDKIKRFYRNKYEPYERDMDALKGVTEKEVEKRVELFDRYYKTAYKFCVDEKIAFQSKFTSTIIEEFLWYLLRDLPTIQNLNLSFYSKKIFAGVKIDSDGSLKIQYQRRGPSDSENVRN